MKREARCECCDLPIYSCGKADARRLAAEAEADRWRLLSMPGVIPAAFASRCVTCGDRYPKGTPIRHLAGDPVTFAGRGWSCCIEVES